MAVGTVLAATADNGTFAPVVTVKKSKALRVTAVGVAAIFACAGLVALVGQASETNHQIQLVSISNSARDAHISALAREFLQHGAQMTQADAINKIRNWHNEELDAPARTQMLAGNSDGLITKKFTQALAGDSLLCEKRQQIIDLFDQLLKKLGGEELSANITLGKVDKAWKEALEGWLAVESEYRLTVEKVKDAREGAKFAREEYEKWTKTYKKAKQDAETAKAANAAERKELDDERELIKQLMRYIGVLHDVKTTEKSIAAGGRESVKDSESGVSDPYATNKKQATSVSELKEKIAHLRAMVLKSATKIPGATQKLALIEQLPVYDETEQVANILKELLDDISTRLSVIDDVDAQMQKMVDDSYAKMVEWEKKLVVLGSEADKAKEKMLADKLKREAMNADKKITTEVHETTTAAYNIMITPWEREIYVITMIKIKINEYCDKIARGEAAEFGK